MEDVLSKFAALGLSSLMLAVAYGARQVSGTWLAPACLYCVAWFLFTFLPLLALLDAPANPLAIAYILATCIAFALPTLATRWPEVFAYAATGPHAELLFNTRFLRISFYFFAIVAVVTLLINASIQGVKISRLTTNFFEVSNSLIADRYSENLVSNVFAQASNIASYTSVALGGLVIGGCRSWKGRLAVIASAMLPALIVMIVFGAKGMIFLCIAMFYGGTLVRGLRRGDGRLISARTLFLSIVIALLVILPATTISFIARGLYEDGSTQGIIDGLKRYFISYTSAHLFAFADWFSWYSGQGSSLLYAKEEVTGGFYTFMSIFKLLGSDRYVPPGVYTEYYQYGYYVQSNVYTIFRGLITDFTIGGSLAITMISGFICNSVFKVMIHSETASWSIAFYISALGFIYSSFIISLLIWNSIYPTFFLIGLILMLNSEFAEVSAARERPELPSPGQALQ